MASEARKIRNQCARKYGNKEKAFREQIASLKAELEAKDAILEDYNNMKRAYMKMLLYLGMNEKDRDKLMRSKELEDLCGKYAGFLGIAGSHELMKLASDILNQDSSKSLVEILAEAEKKWLK